MKWKVRRFNDTDFKNADRLERMYISIVQPNDFELNHTDAEYLAILDKAYPIIKNKPEEEALQMIAHLERGKWKSQIENIYQDSLRLYDAFSISKETLQNIATRQLMIIATDMQLKYETFEDENACARAADVARKAWSDIMKFNRLDRVGGTVGTLPPPPPLPIHSLPVHEIYQDAEIVD